MFYGARVKERDAWGVAGEWRRLGEGRSESFRDLSNWLANELVALISDEVEGAAAMVDGEPAALVLGEEALIVVTLSEGQEAEGAGRPASLDWQTLRLHPAATVRLHEWIEERSPGLAHASPIIVRERAWRFSSGEASVAVSTSEQIMGGFADERQPGADELLARAAAARLGWPIVKPSPSGHPAI